MTPNDEPMPRERQLNRTKPRPEHRSDASMTLYLLEQFSNFAIANCESKYQHNTGHTHREQTKLGITLKRILSDNSLTSTQASLVCVDDLLEYLPDIANALQHILIRTFTGCPACVSEIDQLDGTDLR